MTERKLLRNAIRTPDGTYMESRHTYDYKEHIDSVSGETYIVDGGREYIRRSVNNVAPESLDLYTDDDHEILRKELTWGRNFDKDMNRLPTTELVKIKDLTDGHLKAIVEGNWTSGNYLQVMLSEIEYRKVNNINVEE